MGAKYTHTFNDINEVEHVISLFERGVSHTPTTINCASPGYELEWQGNGSELYENKIYSSRVSIPFIIENSTDETFFTTTLATSPEETFDITITKGGSLLWVGTILSDQINFDRQSIESKLIIQLSAVDGLSRLENYDFDFATQSTFQKTGTALITEILNVNGLSDYFGSGTYFSDGMIFNNANKSSGAGYEYIKLNKLQFRKGDVFKMGDDIEPMNCKEALETLLSGFAAQIFMVDGRYLIRQILPYVNTNVSFLNYNTSGVQISSSSINTSYTVNDGTDNAKPVFSQNPVKSYLPPLQGFKQLLQKTSGYVGEKSTFDTSSITTTWIQCEEYRQIKGGFKIKTKQLNRYAGQKLRVGIKLLVTNGINTKSWNWTTNSWRDPAAFDYIDFEHTSYSEGFVNYEFTTDEPGAGYTQVSMELKAIVNNVAYYQRRGGGVWVVTPGFTDTECSGIIYYRQAYNNTEPVEWQHEAKYKSLAPSPRNRNSVYPEQDLKFKNGREIDVFSLKVYNGSSWVSSGDWSDAEITGFNGDLPYLLNRNWINIYADFVPLIKGNLITDSLYSPVKAIVIDGNRWVFNGGRYIADAAFYDAEWTGIDPETLTITDSELLVKLDKKNTDGALDAIRDRIGDLRNLVAETTERVLVDVFTTADGGVTTDPGTNKDMVFKIKYDNATQTVSAALEARSEFSVSSNRNVIINCGEFDEAGRTTQLRINCGTF